MSDTDLLSGINVILKGCLPVPSYRLTQLDFCLSVVISSSAFKSKMRKGGHVCGLAAAAVLKIIWACKNAGTRTSHIHSIPPARARDCIKGPGRLLLSAAWGRKGISPSDQIVIIYFKISIVTTKLY